MRAVTYKSNGNVSYSCKYYMVWCPNYRRKVLMEDIVGRWKQISSGVCQEQQSTILRLGSMSDHVYLLIE